MEPAWGRQEGPECAAAADEAAVRVVAGTNLPDAARARMMAPTAGGPTLTREDRSPLLTGTGGAWWLPLRSKYLEEVAPAVNRMLHEAYFAKCIDRG